MTGTLASSLSAAAAIALVLAAAATDLRTRRVPNALTGAGVAAGCALAAAQLGHALVTSLLAACAAATMLLAVRLAGHAAYGQPGMGWGDVKLAAALGALLGWNALWALYLAAAAGSAWGLAGRATGRTAPLERIPFAPFIAAGTLAALAAPISSVVTWVAALTGAG